MKLLLMVGIAGFLSALINTATVQCQVPQKVQGQTENEKPNEEVLTPLTDAERQLSPRDIVRDQPDFVADLELFASTGVSAHSWAEHIVRKGTRYRRESRFWVFIGEIGKTSVHLYPQGKVYDDMLPPRSGGITEGQVFSPGDLALESDIAFTALGTIQVGGHNCIKIEAAQKDNPARIYLYAARDLKNLILVAQVLWPKSSTENRLHTVALVQRLRNISLDVPDGLVEIPSDFKPIEHDKWTKVEAAKVAYGAKPSKDFGVFRSPGGELFIWVRDAFYPWEYLYRPKQGTVEIAFQGLLVSREGKYIWLTRETEAFSLTGYRRQSDTTIDAHLVVKPNGITFRSESYEQDGSIIDVTW
jgi:hypothetical protein